MNNTCVLCHEQGRAVGIDLKESGTCQDSFSVSVVNSVVQLIEILTVRKTECDITYGYPFGAGNGAFGLLRDIVNNTAVVLGGYIEKLIIFVKKDVSNDARIQEQRLKMEVFIDIDLLGCCNIENSSVRCQRPYIYYRVFFSAKFEALERFKIL